MEAVEVFSDETKLNKLLSSTGTKNIQNIRLVTLYDYAMEIVYFSDGKQEYAIPYKYNPYFYQEMQNGKAYRMQELIEMIAKEFKATNEIADIVK